jgi:DNA repair exonuclease SbcCD ATPase subunit
LLAGGGNTHENGGGRSGGTGGSSRAVVVLALRETSAGEDYQESARPAADLDAGALREHLQREVDTWSGRVALLEGRAAALDTLRSEAESLDQGAAALRLDLAAAIAAARASEDTAQARSQPIEGSVDDLTPSPQTTWPRPVAPPRPIEGSVDEVRALAADRLAALAAQLQQLDEPATRAAEQEAQRAAGATEASVTALGNEAQSTAARLAVLAGLDERESLGSPDDAVDPGAAAARLREACPEATGPLPGSEALERELQQLDQQVGHLERGREDARAALGDEPPLECEAAAQALARLELEQAARRRAQEIVSETRQRMINKVLPDTIANMCLLLPLLTAGRYRHAELTDDYRLQVWDERKRGYVEKALYSGGTQDQFSLALRLGFALAALPRELGTSPGFLFLDEPLSSFDRDRTAALIDLLTHGQIATFFQQVFLISHSQAFDPQLFTHHVVMEDGHVESSTLPSAT